MSKALKLPTLLVVSDSPTVRFWVKKHLDDRFFIISAENRREAIAALASRLDFIIIDAGFEDCDPLELCKDLRSQVKLIPILLITGRLKKSFRDRAHESGVTDFLSDQLDTAELELRIETGQKAATVREKTVDLGFAIRSTPLATTSSLKNKMVLNDQGLKLLAEAKGKNTPVALLFIQIDQFEKWEVKEEIFQSLVEFIQNLLREKDVLIPSTEGRAVLLLYNTPLDAAKKVAERLKDKIASHPFSGIRKLTVSIVVSMLEASEKSFQKMLDSATKSLKTQTEMNLIISFDEEES
ncbi:MAG: response regulator [Parachlamydiales bacterium]|nr:response regulator [Parachlamydiales bacterium]